MKNVLLTGRPGCGKTTLVMKVVGKLGRRRCGGFFTQEIREEGVRVGFRINSLDGREGILSHVNFKSPYRVGKYSINLVDLEEVGVSSLWNALKEKEVVVVDEIGKMELSSQKFKEALLAALNSEKLLLATIHRHAHPFTDEIKRRGDVELVYVTLENRDNLADELVKKLIS